MSSPSSKDYLFLLRSRSRRSCRVAASVALFLGVLSVSPFFVQAQPSAPESDPTETPTPTPEPTEPAQPEATPEPEATATPAPEPTGTEEPTSTPNPTPTPGESANGVDVSIRRPWLSNWTGQGVVNLSAQGQVVQGKAFSSAPAVFEVQIKNSDAISHRYYFCGPGYSEDGWGARYEFVGANGEVDYDAGWAIMSEEGWLTPEVAPGQALTLTIRAQNWNEAEPLTKQFNFKTYVATPGGRPATPGDVVAANVSFVANPQYVTDLGIASNEYYWEVFGDNVYNPQPGPFTYWGGQTLETQAPTGSQRVFNIVVQNDGQQTDSFHLTWAQSLANGWNVALFDATEGGTDVAGQLTQGGWQTPEIAPGGTIELRLECTPTATASLITPLTAAIRGTSDHEGEAIDVVSAIVYHDKAALDLKIDDLGEGVINTTGQDQTVHVGANALHKLTYRVQGFSQYADVPVHYHAPAPVPGWDVHYFNEATDEDITEAITGNGWTATTQSEWFSFGSRTTPKIRLEITPTSTVGVAPLHKILLMGEATSEEGVRDAVGIEVRRNSSVDVLIRTNRDEDYVGEGVANITGQNQRVARTQLEGAGRRATFVIRVENDGVATDSFKLTAPASGDGWNVRYFDAVENGTDITTAITSEDGWTASAIEAGKAKELRLEVEPDAINPGQVFRNFLVRADSQLDPSAADAVVAGVGFQKIVGVDYSLDRGIVWSHAPLLTGGGTSAPVGIAAKVDQIVGLRAIPSLPDFPWPLDPEIKPLWDNGGYWNVGETIWVPASEGTHVVDAECGNTVRVALTGTESSLSKYTVDLSVSRFAVRVGGGDPDGKTTLLATIKNKAGQPVSGVQVRFRASMDEDAPAGTLDGSGAGHDIAVTGVDGVASISFASGTREGAVTIESVVVLSGVAAAECPKAEPQMFSIFDVHPDPVPDDDF